MQTSFKAGGFFTLKGQISNFLGTELNKFKNQLQKRVLKATKYLRGSLYERVGDSGSISSTLYLQLLHS